MACSRYETGPLGGTESVLDELQRRQKSRNRHFQHVNARKSSHLGHHYVRTMLDRFQITGEHGEYDCSVHEPLWISLFYLQHRHPDQELSIDLLQETLKCLFTALDFLHGEYHLIHADVKANNILMKIGDKSILSDFEAAKKKTPSVPVLYDLGEARYGDQEHDGVIQPPVYRAPEVLLGMKWSYSVDIWNVGVMIWDLFEDKHMFDALDPKTKRCSHRHHLAEMVACIGSPLPNFLDRDGRSSEYFDTQGKLIDPPTVPESLELDISEERLVPGEFKHSFLRFIRSMLQWDPDDRKTAKELLQDP